MCVCVYLLLYAFLLRLFVASLTGRPLLLRLLLLLSPFSINFNLLPLCFCSNMRLSDVRLIGCQFILFARNCGASNNKKYNNKRPSRQATKQKLGNMLRSHTQFQLQLQLLSTSQSPSPPPFQSLLKLLSLLTGYRLRLRCCDYSCCCSSLPAN